MEACMEPEITVIIIDDDLGSIQKLQNDLLAFSEVRILDTATTAELGKRHILKYQPDLVFLDVELPDMSGFDLLVSGCNRNTDRFGWNRSYREQTEPGR